MKEMNHRIRQWGKTLMALTSEHVFHSPELHAGNENFEQFREAVTNSQILANDELPFRCSVGELSDKEGNRYDLWEVFDAFMRFGGMPGIADVGLNQEKALSLLDGIYSTVVIRYILEREKRRGQQRITDSALLKKIVLFLADNIGSNISLSNF